MYANLGKDDEEHARFDDVRSAAMAIVAVREDGLSEWAGNALSTASLGNIDSLEQVVGRGLSELAALHQAYGVK